MTVPARTVPTRRIVASAALFLALAAGGVGALAAVPGGGPGDRGGFTLAVPHVGDQGRYTWEPRGPDSVPGAWFGLTAWMEFEWLPDIATYDQHGNHVWANQVRTYEDLGDGVSLDMVHRLLAGTGRRISVVQQVLSSSADDGGSYASSSTVVSYQDFGGVLPCGFLSVLQGRTLALAPQEFADTLSCPGYEPPGGNLATVRVIGATVMDGFSYIQVERTYDCCPDDRPATRAWYREDIPYPVRIETGYAEDGALALTGFHRGGQPLRGVSGPAGPDAPGIVLAPRQPWGMDDAGVLHPFPASQAYALAHDGADPRLRDFLSSRPEAYAARVDYSETEQDGVLARTWHFLVTDAEAEIRFTVSHSPPAAPAPVPPLPSGLPTFPPPLGPASPAGAEVRIDDPEPAARPYLPPEAVPRSVPTVASLQRLWGTVTQAQEPANAWSLSIGCAMACPLRSLDFSAGRTNSSLGADWHTTYSSSLGESTYGFPADGGEEPHELVTWVGWDTRSDWARNGPAGGDPAPAPRIRGFTDTAFAVGAWRFPDAGPSAAVGLGAAVLSLLYLGWPAVKVGVMGLFSRVDSSEVLRNPLRRQLLERIEAQPGVHHGELVRLLGRGNGAVDHHVGRLLAAGLVRRVRTRGFTCYFPRSSSRAEVAAAPVVKSQVARAIVQHLRDEPGMTQAELARRLGVSQPTIHYHLGRLRDAGVAPARPGAARRGILPG